MWIKTDCSDLQISTETWKLLADFELDVREKLGQEKQKNILELIRLIKVSNVN